MFGNSISLFLIVILADCHGFTHWIVTETGRIEPKLNTHFYLRRPYDLLALLDQERRRNDLDILTKEMERQKNLIDKRSKLASFLHGHDCVGGLEDMPRNILANNGSDRVHLQFSFNVKNIINLKVEPSCIKFYDLPFGMSSFEHFESMRNRKNSKRETCGDCIPEMDWSLARTAIVTGLTENNTSWVHYNLGILYWWNLGNLFEALECARRAIHFAPIRFLDIPLANLGQILYMHGDKPDEAIAIIKSAISHAPNESKYYLLLGQAYFRSGEYENGAKVFETYKLLQQNNKEDINYDSIKCLMNLLIRLKEYQELLEGILADFHEFHNSQQRFLSLHERLLWEIAPYEFNFPFMVAKKLLSLQGGEHCHESDSGAQVTCDFSSPAHIDIFKGFKDNMENILENYRDKYNKFVTNTENLHNQKIREIDEKTQEQLLMQQQKYPVTINLLENEPLMYFDEASWPSKEECLKWDLPLSEDENLDIPVFVPLENKGFQVTKILADFIDIPQEKEHDLPWHPPLCDFIREIELEQYLPESVRPNLEKNHPLPMNDHFVGHFLSYINGGKSSDAEIGQRILTAFKKKTAPPWILAVLANMYWRSRQNTCNALKCLYSFSELPDYERFGDVVLVPLASMLQQMGFNEMALNVVQLAYSINYKEPSTNFLLGLIQYRNDNPILAAHYMKRVVRFDPNFYGGEADRLMQLWSCRIKLGEFRSRSNEIRNFRGYERVCRDDLNTEAVVCSANGEECKTAAIQCFKASSMVKAKKKKYAANGADSGKQCGDRNESFLFNYLDANYKKTSDLHQMQLGDFRG